MSTPAAVPPRSVSSSGEHEIWIISHSNLFYWWPVWAVGFLMGLLTIIDNHRMVVVPSHAELARGANVELPPEQGKTTTYKDRDVVILPENQHLPLSGSHAEAKEAGLRHMANSQVYGVIFAITLLLVIVITNVPLRGMWSVVVIITVILLTIILALSGFLVRLVEWIQLLDIRVNAAGYIFVALALFLIWVITFVFFDRQIYMVFTPGQLKVRTEIGGGEKAYDTAGMTIEKQRSDLFRHWILGLGSGDLVVNTAGAHVQHFDLPNVLFIGKKVQAIEDMLREKKVLASR
jgi:hypothetical protein